MNSEVVFAAIDLGSHSFELCIKTRTDGGWKTLENHKKRVRLIDGIDATGRLSDRAVGRALQALDHFNKVLRGYPQARIRAVGTKALRTASNSDALVRRIASLFGWQVDIVEGLEEARLIFQGIRSMSPAPESFLAIDVGGGSTEFIVGQGDKPVVLESLSVGCLSFHKDHLAGRPLNQSALEQARLSLENALLPIAEQISWHAWEEALGCSGSLEALMQVQAALGGSPYCLTREGLQRLEDQILQHKEWQELALPGLNDERQQLIPAATTMARAFFNRFDLQALRYCPAALKDGVIQELYDDRLAEHARLEGVITFARRHRIDIDQVERVLQTVERYVSMVQNSWHLRPRDLALLKKAVWLHEIGKSVSVHGYARHSAYLVQHAELAGFTKQEQQNLAWLVGLHTGPLASEDTVVATKEKDARLWHLLRLLRLAIIECSDRRSPGCLKLSLTATGDTLIAKVSVLNPEQAKVVMTALDREIGSQRQAGFRLQLQLDLNLHKT